MSDALFDYHEGQNDVEAALRKQPASVADTTQGGASDVERSAGGTFLDFYAAYPRHVGRVAAEKAWRQAVMQIHPADLLAAVRTFAESRKNANPAFTPHPATWLNQRRWLDDDAQPVAPPMAPIVERPKVAPEPPLPPEKFHDCIAEARQQIERARGQR